MRDNLITEEDFNNTKEIEHEYLKLAENLIDQLAESTHWKCNEFDSQKMLAMFLKKNIHKVYEFTSVDDNSQLVVFENVKPQYPKTYEECCKVLGVNPSFDIRMLEDEESTLYFKFIDLVRCRNAYWKIAGEQMGLGKSWEPDWENTETDKYVIEIVKNTITMHDYPWNETNHLLAFPTKEMRDAFYENFKDLIIECKKLL